VYKQSILKAALLLSFFSPFFCQFLFFWLLQLANRLLDEVYGCLQLGASSKTLVSAI
jgi:hypothetical protein